MTRGNRIVASTLVAWLAGATTLGASGRLQTLQPPIPQLIIIALTVTALVAVAAVPAVRAWAAVVDCRALVAFHLTRFVGIYFLVLYQRGELPYAFAVPAGWGDIAVAVLAIALIAMGSSSGRPRAGYLAWNTLGLVDILFVLATATRLALADPFSLAPLLRLPLSLVPTFVVPLIITTHVILFVRLARAGGAVQAV